MQPVETIPALFEKVCRWHPDHELFTDDRHRLTGSGARIAVRRATRLLLERGVRPGDRVAILAGPSVAEAVAFFAVMAAGAVPCCLHVRETVERNGETLDVIEARLVIADAALVEPAEAMAVGNRPVLTVEALIDAGGTEAAPLAVDPEAPALILLSSGSTGAPKQILHTHHTLMATAMTAGPLYGATSSEEVMVVPMAPSFAAWIHVVLPMMAIGAQLHFQRAFTPAAYVDLLEQEACTITALVPTLWRMILPDLERRDLPRLRVGMFSGEPGTPDLVAALTGRFADVRSVYLASEGGCASGIVACASDLLRPGGAGAAGRPVPTGDVAIVDPDRPGLVPVAAGEIGEIAVRGPSVSTGYLGRAEQTAATFVDGWWRTGDLGRLDEGGLVQVAGRIDNRINSGGIKVHAEEVEAALRSLDLVRDVAVVGMPDPTWGERIEAHVVASDPASAMQDLEQALREALDRSGLLPDHKRPKRYHFRDTLPIGPTGKLQRRDLK
jgi:acyl-CoA synthetase (AMP-forming)/AMP-acid ligase II